MIATIRCIGVDASVTAADMRQHGIRAGAEELRHVADCVARDLTVAEAFLIDVAYSEHCSYKSSRRFLKELLPPLADHVLIGPGEDAGVIDIGEWNGKRYALVVAHESHNHPSQLLPVEGAATGIGGIVRDVYCMGADVIGVLDGLRFGDLDGPAKETTRAVARGVIRGIWEYGNALGVPNLGGDVAFDGCYDDNCLVNVVALGIAPTDRIVRSSVPKAAQNEPYDLILVGKPTDQSGLGGASFASQVLDAEDADQNLGAVQIHDPFLKRVLVEATKAVWDLLFGEGIDVGFKDLGAGGFGGASSELVVSGGFGAEIDLDELPAALESIPPEHLLIGETQERFVWAVPSHAVASVLRIYNEQFDLPGIYPGACAALIGRVVPDPIYRVRWKGEPIVDLPLGLLKETPILDRPTRSREIIHDPGAFPIPDDWQRFAEQLLTHPALASRSHIYRHYDAEVRGEAVIRPGEADAGVCRPIPGASLGVAVSLDGNGRWCALDPYHGAIAGVLESLRNLVAVGARPRALTDCLNFGSPEDPDCLWEFEQCLKGIRDACIGVGLPEDAGQALPIVSGNVSFYNQSAAGKRIDPTPILGAFGTLADWRHALKPRFKEPGNKIYVISGFTRAWGGSAALDLLGGQGCAPRPAIAEERARIYGMLDLLEKGSVRSCHDFAEGGLLVGLLEALFFEEGPTGLGAEVDFGGLPLPVHEALLTECGGFLFELAESDEKEARRILGKKGVEPVFIGTVAEGGRLVVRSNGAIGFELELAPLWKAWAEKLGNWMEGESTER